MEATKRSIVAVFDRRFRHHLNGHRPPLQKKVR